MKTTLTSSARWSVIALASGLAALSLGKHNQADSSGGDLRADMGRIVKYLASDELRGRQAPSPGARMAAEFISSEFASAGLKPLEGSRGYLDNIPIVVQEADSETVLLDGKPAEQFFIRSEVAAIDLGSGQGAPPAAADSSAPLIEIRVMGEKFDRSLLRGGTPAVVLIPTVHKALFDRFAAFYGRAQIRLAGPAADTAVVAAVLTDAPGAASCRIFRRSVITSDTLANVSAMIPGRRSGEIVLFSAHYDHIGIIDQVNGDSIANGANDNASGTAALLGLAKHYALAPQPERTLVFSAFTAEEIGGFGAKAFVKRYPPDSIVAMVNIEMVGTESVYGPRTFWITGYDRSDLGPLVAKALEGGPYRAHPDPYPDENLFERSDNAAFARLGVPAHSFSTARIDIDSNYHAVTDEFRTIDPGHLAEVVRALADGTRGLATGTMTPSRIEVTPPPGGR